MNINTKDLKIAEVRYFDTEHNGVAVPSFDTYAFLLKIGENYVNIMKPEKDYPVYERVPYRNTTEDGWEFGTKILLVSGEYQDGLCYVVGDTSMEDVLGIKTISKRELIHAVIKSKQFFIDVAEIRKKKRHSIFDKQYRKEQKLVKDFYQYIDSCQIKKQYYK